ncbi:hypothetical protein ACFV4G_28455 [Kitasatospora sp. NPDC059747]
MPDLGPALIEQGRADEARELLTEALTDLSADGRQGRRRTGTAAAGG